MQDITIAVSEAGTAAARTFAYKIQFEGSTVAERTLTPVQSQQVMEIGTQYFSLLQREGREKAEKYLPILASALSHLFLEADPEKWRERVLPGARLSIISSIPEALWLPWELLPILGPGREKEIGFSVIRRLDLVEGISPPGLEPSSGPLRLLFLAAGHPEWEEEEKGILQMAEGLKMEIVVCESGRMEELKALAEQFRPHLLHLAVRVGMMEGQPTVALPKSSGGEERISGDDLAALHSSGILGVVISGRQRNNPSGIHLLCQRLSRSFPLALAWEGPAARTRPLYQALAAGQSVEEALLCLRREAAGSAGQNELTSSPSIYCAGEADLRAVIEGLSSPSARQGFPCRELLPLPGLAEGGAECFLDRRRDTERLFPALRDGSVQTLIITGGDGSGKSSLAVHLSRLLAAAGYTVVPFYSSAFNQITWPRLLEGIASSLRRAGQEAEAKSLIEPGSMDQKQSRLLDVLRSRQWLLLLDGLALERNGRIQDPDLSRFYLLMIRGMNACRAIITTTALPKEALTLPARAWQWKTEGLSAAAFIRRLLYSPATAESYRNGGISFAGLAEHHRLAGGLPHRLDQIARALGLEAMAPGEDALTVLTSRLDRPSFAALCRAAVYEVAVSPSGLAAAGGLTEAQAEAAARQWKALSLAQGRGGLWTVPSSLRPSLRALLPLLELQSAHKAAAGFLKALAEAGRSAELELSRLDLLLEARGHYLAAKDTKAAASLTGQISGYLRRRGYYAEVIRLNRELVGDDFSGMAGPAAWIGQSYLDLEDFRAAAEWYGLALQVSPDPASYHGLGLALMHQEKFDPARDNLEKAAHGYRSSGEPSGEAAALSSLAAMDMKKGEIVSAQEKLERIAEIMRALGDGPGEAQVWQEAARLEMVRSDFDSARKKLQRSLQLLQDSRDRRAEAYALFNLASLDLETGDFQAAGAEYDRALPLFREMGDQAGVAAILHSQGLIRAQAGDKEQAAQSFREALAINQELGDRAAEAGSFFQLGALAVQQDHMAEGLRLMALAAVVLRSIKSDEVGSVEPLVERLASQLNYSQEQFMAMVQEVLQGYAKDRGWGLVKKAWEG